VQLDPAAGKKWAYGLGLAIVKRAIEWHGGQWTSGILRLGGALVRASWPIAPADTR